MPISADHANAVLKRATCLYTGPAVQQAVERVAGEITTALAHKNPIILCIMTGGLIPTSELLLRLDFPLQLDYIHATRYANRTKGHQLEWLVCPKLSLENRTILIVDDILDVGLTLAATIDYCQSCQASEVYSAVLVDKKHDRKQGVRAADFTALVVPDQYVFGYGMDYKGYLRNVTGIFAAHKDDE